MHSLHYFKLIIFKLIPPQTQTTTSTSFAGHLHIRCQGEGHRSQTETSDSGLEQQRSSVLPIQE